MLNGGQIMIITHQRKRNLIMMEIIKKIIIQDKEITTKIVTVTIKTTITIIVVILVRHL